MLELGLDTFGDVTFGDDGSLLPYDEVIRTHERVGVGQKRAHPALLEMRQESQRGLGNARVAESAY